MRADVTGEGPCGSLATCRNRVNDRPAAGDSHLDLWDGQRVDHVT
jgi:hypothetical protein